MSGFDPKAVATAAEFCRAHGYTPRQLRGMAVAPSGDVMEGDFEKAVWACLRKRQ